MHASSNKIAWVLTVALVCSVITTACRPQKNAAHVAPTPAVAHAAPAAFACDDGCLLDPSVPQSAGAIYAVVAPVGQQTIAMIEQAPRLDNLDGKTIAVVGGSFMAYVTHPEIRRLILQQHPSAKVFELNEVGSAGPFPGPGIVRQSQKDFQRKLKELGVDGVISGNGGCGLCTPKEAGSSITAEYMGIPAVTIAAPAFVTQVISTAVNNGVPAPRTATYPGAFASHSRDELIQNTREVLWPQIVDALTKPISDAEIAEHRKTAVSDNPRDIVFAGTVDEINRHFSDMRWSDGLPIVPPTIAKVEEFLAFTDRAWDDSVGVLPIAYRDTLVWQVAVNGVMAGCPAEFMPLLIAFTQALADPNYRRTLSSTHAWTPYCWVNGPVARQLGIDSQQGLISEPRNAVLGRFINLAMMNLAGYYIKQDRMGTFGYLMPWSMAEDEAACLKVGWKPYHVQQGYGLNDNTLTGASALLWGNNLTPASHDPAKILDMMAWDVVEKSQFATGSGRPFTFRTILLTEFVARDLAQAYASKDRLEDALIATARRPAYQRAYANYWANPGSAFDPDKYSVDMHLRKIIRDEDAELTAIPPWYPQAPGMEKIHTVPAMKKGMTPILVTGDPDRNKVQTMPGGSCVTIKIDLPGNWDDLMAQRGYRPLAEFYLQ